MKNGAILLIDDSEPELKLCEIAMRGVQHNHKIITFQNPEVALEYITNNLREIFMIICDINMPKMTGIELLRKINKDHEMKIQAIPFIFLSNSSTSRDVEIAYSLAAQGYFQKPNDIHDLTEIFKCIISYWSRAQIPRE